MLTFDLGACRTRSVLFVELGLCFSPFLNSTCISFEYYNSNNLSNNRSVGLSLSYYSSLFNFLVGFHKFTISGAVGTYWWSLLYETNCGQRLWNNWASSCCRKYHFKDQAWCVYIVFFFTNECALHVWLFFFPISSIEYVHRHKNTQ